MTNDLDRIKPVKFPTVWLTYKARIRRDFDRAYSSEGGAEYFGSDYFSRLCTQVKQLEDWLIKLFILQIALTGFQVVGFIGNDASISLFGITLKQATGVKEILIALYAFIAVAAWMVIISRDTALTVLERLVELSTGEPFVEFGKLAAPTSFNVKFYMPSAYEDWIFPTRANQLLFVVFVVTAVSISLAVFLFSLAVNLVFVLDIYRHPTLGVWSTWILGYVGLTLFFGLIFLIRFYFPQPYQDQSVLLALKALEEVDSALFRRKRAEIYGVHSRYRKYKWSHRIVWCFDRAKSCIVSSGAAGLVKLRTLVGKLSIHV
jgi:hypothetical protein